MAITHSWQILHLRHFLLQTNFTFYIQRYKGIKGKCLFRDLKTNWAERQKTDAELQSAAKKRK